MLNIKSFFKINTDIDNTKIATEQLLKKLKVQFAQSELRKKLSWSPTYPSIKSIKVFLKSIKVESIIIDADKNLLPEMPQLMLCHLHENGGEFIIVVKHNKESVTVLDNESKEIIIPYYDFIERWSGVVLLAEATEKSGIKNYKQKKISELLENNYFWLTPTFIFICSSIYLLTKNEYVGVLKAKYLIFNILNLLGLILSLLILDSSIKGGNVYLNKICSTNTKNDGCSQFLKSDKPFFLGISLSDLAFIWFSSSTLFGLVTLNASYLFLSATFITIIAVIFSIAYQLIISKWCKICLFLSGMLLSQCILVYNIIGIPKISLILFSDVLIYISLFVLISAIWFSLKSKVYSQPYLESAQQGYYNLKLNRRVFNTLHDESSALIFDNSNYGFRINPETKGDELIIVGSLSCMPCATAFKIVKKMLELGTEISIKILITIPPDKNDSKYKVLSILIHIYKEFGAKPFLDAIDYWFTIANNDIANFTKRYNYNYNVENFEENGIIENMSEWFSKNSIESTPTFYLNNIQVRNDYSINDIILIFDN